MAKPEGKYFKFNSEDDINPDFLETFPFDSPDQYIMTETDEFSAVCPFSGLPDMAYVKIAVSYTHLRAHETEAEVVCRLLL